MNHQHAKTSEQLHVLITGATGFIGANLSAALQRRGHTVTALTRAPVRSRTSPGPGVDTCSWRENLASKRFDAVVNLAGARIAPVPWTSGRRRVLRDSRIANTERLVKSLSAGVDPPRIWIQASAVGYYGMTQTDKTMDEGCAAGEDFASNLCRDWEAAARPIQALGARLCTLRMGLVLGKCGALPGLLLPIRLALGGPLGSGSQPFPWIHIDDVVRLILACLEDSRYEGAYNAVAPEQHTQSSFARCAAALLHRPYWLRTPALPLTLLGEVSQLFLAGRQVAPRRLLEASWDWAYPELKPALASLIAPPTSSKSISEPK